MKRRFSLTLTPENVAAFKAALKRNSMPPNVLSSAVDDFIKEMAVTLNKCADKGSVNFLDFFTMLGEQVQQVVNEEKAHDKEFKKNVKTGKGN